MRGAIPTALPNPEPGMANLVKRAKSSFQSLFALRPRASFARGQHLPEFVWLAGDNPERNGLFSRSCLPSLVQSPPHQIHRKTCFRSQGCLLHNLNSAVVSGKCRCNTLLFNHLQQCCQLATFSSLLELVHKARLLLASCQCKPGASNGKTIFHVGDFFRCLDLACPATGFWQATFRPPRSGRHPTHLHLDDFACFARAALWQRD